LSKSANKSLSEVGLFHNVSQITYIGPEDSNLTSVRNADDLTVCKTSTIGVDFREGKVKVGCTKKEIITAE